MSNARAVLLITHGVVLLVVPPGSPIKSIDDLKGKAVGNVGGAINKQVVDVISKEYDLQSAKVSFVDLAPFDVPAALKSKRVSALLIVMPISQKYLSLLRGIFPQTGKQTLGLIPIESAGAIAAIAKTYESFDLPKGTIRGTPAIPDEDLTTLRVPFYLVANKKLNDDVVGALAKGFMEARRELLGEYPLLAQVAAPNTDKDAFLTVHSGAAAYFSGDQKSFFDKYGDQFFYGSMLLGTLTSLLAACWKFMTRDERKPESSSLVRLYALVDRINLATSETDLAAIEQSIDEILRAELQSYASSDSDSNEAAALGLTTHRLEHLIDRRRAILVRTPAPALTA
jgi:hypothetical protein